MVFLRDHFWDHWYFLSMNVIPHAPSHLSTNTVVSKSQLYIYQTEILGPKKKEKKERTIGLSIVYLLHILKGFLLISVQKSFFFKSMNFVCEML